MNPLSNVRSLNKINDREIEMGVVGTASSWHKRYKGSAWIFFGGMPYELTEGDIICVFSQYGEVVNINLIRDKKSGKSKGYGFICFEDQRSTDLVVDNFNGIQLLERTIRVDHVLDYRPPKENEDENDIITNFLQSKGCAPEVIEEKLNSLKEFENRKVIKKEKNFDSSSKKIKKEIKNESDEDLDNIRDLAKKKSDVKIKKEKRSDEDDDNDRLRAMARKNDDIKIKKEKNSDDDNDDVRSMAKLKSKDDRKYDNNDYNSHKKHKKERSRSRSRERNYRHRSRSPKKYDNRSYHKYRH